MSSMSTILRAFFARLDEHPAALPLDVLSRELQGLDITLDDLQPWVKFRDDCYARNRIHIGPGYHALALCWRGGQHSPIHDHSGSGCGVLVVTGQALETVFDRGSDGMLSRRANCVHDTGSVCVSFDADIHRLGNNSADQNLVTLHIYSPPLLEWGVYREDSPDVQRCQDEQFDELTTAQRAG